MLCLTENGTVYSFGENKLGQLGQGNQTDAVLSPATVRLSLTHLVEHGLSVLNATQNICIDLPTDPVQRAADSQSGLWCRVHYDCGLQGEPLFFRLPRIRPTR